MITKGNMQVFRCRCDAFLLVHTGQTTETMLKETQAQIVTFNRKKNISNPVHVFRGQAGQDISCPECGAKHTILSPDLSDKGEGQTWIGPPFRQVQEDDHESGTPT